MNTLNHGREACLPLPQSLESGKNDEGEGTVSVFWTFSFESIYVCNFDGSLLFFPRHLDLIHSLILSKTVLFYNSYRYQSIVDRPTLLHECGQVLNEWEI